MLARWELKLEQFIIHSEHWSHLISLHCSRNLACNMSLTWMSYQVDNGRPTRIWLTPNMIELSKTNSWKKPKSSATVWTMKRLNCSSDPEKCEKLVTYHLLKVIRQWVRRYIHGHYCSQCKHKLLTGRGDQLQSSETNVIKGFVVEYHALIRILH